MDGKPRSTGWSINIEADAWLQIEVKIDSNWVQFKALFVHAF